MVENNILYEIFTAVTAFVDASLNVLQRIHRSFYTTDEVGSKSNMVERKESKFTFLAISHVGIISFLFQSRKLRDSGCIAFKYYFSEYKTVKDK